jgi:hypothetical protein
LAKVALVIKKGNPEPDLEQIEQAKRAKTNRRKEHKDRKKRTANGHEWTRMKDCHAEANLVGRGSRMA